MTVEMTLNDRKKDRKFLSGHFPPPAIEIIIRESPVSRP